MNSADTTITTITATQSVTTTLKASYQSPPNLNGKKKGDKSTQISHHKPHHIEFSRSLRIAKGLFASFMLFTLCWLIFVAAIFYDFSSIKVVLF